MKLLAEQIIRSVDWGDWELSDGPAHGFGDQLAEFVAPEPTKSGAELWQTMENKVFSQDDVFSAAEPTIAVLLAALAEPQRMDRRIATLDLLYHLLHAAHLRGDEFGGRCLASAADGGWLLVREAMTGGSAVREACLEVLDICAPRCATVLRLVG